MMVIGDVMDSNTRPQQSLRASLDSALNQSRATTADHASGLARGFSSNGLHNKLKRPSYANIGGNQHLGFVSVSEANQEQADWVSGSLKGVSGSVKEMGSFSIGMEISGGAIDGKRSCLEIPYAGEKKVYDKAVKCSLKIQVIDETALLETVSVPKSGNGRGKEMGLAGSAKEAERENANQVVDEKKAKQSRSKGKGARKAFDSNRKQKNLIHMAKAQRAVTKRVYSRKEMEALRFVQVQEQQKMWKNIYIGLGPSVAGEYDDLAIARHQKKQVPNFDPRPQRYGKNPSPGILGVAAARGRGYHMNNIFVH